jgi:hypothetical protein
VVSAAVPRYISQRGAGNIPLDDSSAAGFFDNGRACAMRQKPRLRPFRPRDPRDYANNNPEQSFDGGAFAPRAGSAMSMVARHG